MGIFDSLFGRKQAGKARLTRCACCGREEVTPRSDSRTVGPSDGGPFVFFAYDPREEFNALLLCRKCSIRICGKCIDWAKVDPHFEKVISVETLNAKERTAFEKMKGMGYIARCPRCGLRIGLS